MQSPTVHLTRIEIDDMEKFVKEHSDIGLDWYVLNLVNTRVIDLIRNKAPINPSVP